MARGGAALGAVAVALATGACATPRVAGVRDPAGARRFEILAVGDSTFSFLAAGAPWVRAGIPGIAVDPRRRDALVARFAVTARVADTATALVTGQTAHVAGFHVALLEAPRPRMSRRQAFWLGVLTGGAFGAAAVTVAR